MSVFRDQIDLNLLLDGLETYPDRLSPHLLQQLKSLLPALQQQDSQATRELLSLIQDVRELDQLYEQALRDRRSGYLSQERLKSIPLAIHSTGQGVDLPELQGAIQQIRQTLDSICTRQQAIALSQTKQAILQALDRSRLRPKDLVHTIGQPWEQIQPILESLWQAGYIDRLQASPLYTIFPSLRSPDYRQRSIPTQTFLTLTSKGYFALHPLFKKANNTQNTPSSEATVR
ncbi:MAG: hypothetical protein VKJ24_09090 [Synechococcales bacterium]|nr:hypothetical protein [Synechococcales bacterium]